MNSLVVRSGQLHLLTGLALLMLTPLASAAPPRVAFAGGLPRTPPPVRFTGPRSAAMRTPFTTPFAIPPATPIASRLVSRNPSFPGVPSNTRFLRQTAIDPLTRFSRNAALTQSALAASQGFTFGSAFTPSVNAALLTQSANLLALNNGLNNPFAAGALPGYAALAGAWGGYGGAYGGGYGGGSGGGGGMGGGGDSGQWVSDYMAQVKAADQARHAPTLFTAFGLPSQDGRLQWPLGIRVLPGTGEAAQLRDQIDLLAEAVMGQKAENGRADAWLVGQTSRAIDGLRQQLAARSTDLPLTTYEDARRFLRQLDDTVQGLR